MTRACVIGAGIGGLALAIRLQAAGVATTVIEARDKPGGRAYFWERDGFTFDAGPTVITDPGALEELWQLSGHALADDVKLMPVRPFWQLSWPDGTSFEISNDEAALRREIDKIAPDDLAGYEEFLRYATGAYREGYLRLASQPFPDFVSIIRAAPALARWQAWRSLFAIVASHVKSEKLREALSFQTLLIGGNPLTASALYAAMHKLEKDGGVWWTQGGINRLVAGMVRHFERLGGTLRLHDPVCRIEALGNRVTGVETQSGWHERFDAVASNADLIHTYRKLLGGTVSGPATAARLSRKRFSPSLFVVHFGIEGSWPGVPHQMILFGPRYRGLLDDIFDHGVLPQDMLIQLHHPTVTDPSVAPEGKSTFTALVPVAHLGKLPIDWEQFGPMLEKRILDEVGRRLIPDIHDRILTKFHYAPRDFALDLDAHLGSAFGLEPILSQSGWLRPHNRDPKLANFYLVGAGTHPGAGIPGVLASAKVTARLMLDERR
ncbi:MAG: phytoene desaturase [Novosphingobium sp.]|nr:phytoene desaturase [Novosphingobium sp.]